MLDSQPQGEVSTTLVENRRLDLVWRDIDPRTPGVQGEPIRVTEWVLPQVDSSILTLYTGSQISDDSQDAQPLPPDFFHPTDELIRFYKTGLRKIAQIHTDQPQTLEHYRTKFEKYFDNELPHEAIVSIPYEMRLVFEQEMIKKRFDEEWTKLHPESQTASASPDNT